MAEELAIQGTLFNVEDYTYEKIRSIMQNNTCRHCMYRSTVHQGYEGKVSICVCTARKSNRTKSGYMRTRVDNPACLMFTKKN